MEHVEPLKFWRAELSRVLAVLPAAGLHDIAVSIGERPSSPCQYAAHPVLNWPSQGVLRYRVEGRWRRFTSRDFGYARAGSWKQRAEQSGMALAKCALRESDLLLIRNRGAGPAAALRYPLPDPSLFVRYETACSCVRHRELRIRAAVTELLLAAEELVARDPGRSDPGASTFAAAVAYIEEQLGEDLDRGRVARQVGCHPGHLSRLFRIHAQQAFTPWLRARRLRLACTLLANTDLRVATIAAHAGFGSATYLIRCFRNAYGTSPERWRREQA
jgi:AraC-like DNA-binding protein